MAFNRECLEGVSVFCIVSVTEECNSEGRTLYTLNENVVIFRGGGVHSKDGCRIIFEDWLLPKE
jgi:hypothetical protein